MVVAIAVSDKNYYSKLLAWSDTSIDSSFFLYCTFLRTLKRVRPKGYKQIISIEIRFFESIIVALSLLEIGIAANGSLTALAVVSWLANFFTF